MAQGRKDRFDVQRCNNFIEKEFTQSALPALQEYIQIQNISKEYVPQADWPTTGWDNLLKAAESIQRWVVQKSGINNLKTCELIYNKEDNLTPLIYIQVTGTIHETYLFYGHYDKQPPFTGWTEGLGPYKPVLYPSAENPQKLYGRGGADDGYSTFGSILAIKALQDQGLPHPRCVFTIEGDQESGTGDVEKHIANLKDRIGHPRLIFCLDSGTLDYKRFWATTSLRGYLSAVVTVSVLNQGVHSGTSSGIVPNSFRILRSLLERIQSYQTGDMSTELNVNVPPNRYKEMYEVAQKLKEDAVHSFPMVQGLERVKKDVLQTLIANGWSSQMVVTSVEGYPPINVAGNVMLPYTSAKLSIRLPPTLKPQDAIDYVTKTLTTDVPYNAQVQVKTSGGEGFDNAIFPPIIENAISGASKAFFNEQYLTIAEGGSIPFMGYLRGLWPNAQFIVTGVLGPESNAHGPNEFLDIPYVKKLIGCISYIVAHTTVAR